MRICEEVPAQLQDAQTKRTTPRRPSHGRERSRHIRGIVPSLAEEAAQQSLPTGTTGEVLPQVRQLCKYSN